MTPYQVLPDLSAEDFAALRADIAAPVGITFDDFVRGPITGRFVKFPQAVTIDIWENTSENPGYYHVRAVETGGLAETIRPVLPVGVPDTVAAILGPLRLTASDLVWRSTPSAMRLPEARQSKGTGALPSGSVVYFLRAGEFIKIGKATGSPQSRVASLKTGCPFPIDVIGFVAGGYDEERGLHRRFGHLRAHGEWFHAAPDLCAHIAQLLGTDTGGVAA